MFRRSASGRTRVMSGTRATVSRTWVANWSCALPAAPRAGLPTAACPRRPERRRDCQRLPTCFAFPVRWRPRFAASTGSDGCLVPHSMRATVDGTTCAASATSRCDMPDFARATGPGQSGDNKRLRKLAHTMAWLIGVLGAVTSVGDDDLWVGLDPPRVCSLDRGSNAGIWPAAPSTATAPRSPLLLGSAAASAVHFGHGPPLGWALAGAKVDECDVPIEILSTQRRSVHHQGIGDDHRRQEHYLRSSVRRTPGRVH